jgi:hypothetical protein
MLEDEFSYNTVFEVLNKCYFDTDRASYHIPSG